MEKTKILQVISELGDGGVEAMLMDIYRNIDKEKFSFIFIASKDNGRYTDEINKYGGKVIIISPLKQIGIIKYVKKIIKICKDEKIDVVHAHNLTQNCIVLLAAFLAGVKVRISHSHLTTCFSKKAEILMPIIRFSICTLSTHRLACGNEAGKFLYGKKSFYVIKNAINIEKFVTATKINTLSDINLGNKYVLLHVGRLSEQKNHKFLIEIMKNLDDDIILLCCGTGPLESQIKEMIRKNNLNNIFLLGSRKDIPNLMKSANLMLLPSLYEGLPVSLIESQASGLKALASTTIDRDSDLKLNLVDFLPIGENNLNLWINKINFYRKNNYTIPNNIEDVLTNSGYNSEKNCDFISSIYKGENI